MLKDGNDLFVGFPGRIEKYDISDLSSPVKTAEAPFAADFSNGYYGESKKLKITCIKKSGGYLFCSLRYPTNGLCDMLVPAAAGKNFGGLAVIRADDLSPVRTLSLPYKCCFCDLLDGLCVLTYMHHGFAVFDTEELIYSPKEPAPLFAYKRALLSAVYAEARGDPGSFENGVDNKCEYQSACLWKKENALYCTFALYRGGVSTWDLTNVREGKAEPRSRWDIANEPSLCALQTRACADGSEGELLYPMYSIFNCSVKDGVAAGAFASAYSELHGHPCDKSGIVTLDALKLSDPRVSSLPASLIPPGEGIYYGSDIGPTFAAQTENAVIVNAGPYGLAAFEKNEAGEYVFRENVKLKTDGRVNTYISLTGGFLCTASSLRGRKSVITICGIK